MTRALGLHTIHRSADSACAMSYATLGMRVKVRLEAFIINAKKPVHVAWWAQEFGVSEKLLLEAIAAVGERAHDVNAYLKKQEMKYTDDSGSITVTTQA